MDVYDEDGEPINVSKWTHKIVCPRCHGTGKHVNPSIDGNGITGSEMEELGDDFRDDYLNGAYDVVCRECNGRNVVDEVDEVAFSEDAPELFLVWERAVNEWHDADAVERQERRMGA